MRRLVITFIVAICCITAHADTGRSLFITFSDGSKIEFALAATPEITAANDKLTVTSSTTTASYDLYTVKTFTYGTTTGIKATETSSPFTISGNRLIVNGDNNQIRIIAIDGKIVSISPIQTGNTTVISLDELPGGVYIINVNGQSIKISKR